MGSLTASVTLIGSLTEVGVLFLVYCAGWEVKPWHRVAHTMLSVCQRTPFYREDNVQVGKIPKCGDLALPSHPPSPPRAWKIACSWFLHRGSISKPFPPPPHLGVLLSPCRRDSCTYILSTAHKAHHLTCRLTMEGALEVSTSPEITRRDFGQNRTCNHRRKCKHTTWCPPSTEAGHLPKKRPKLERGFWDGTTFSTEHLGLTNRL